MRNIILRILIVFWSCNLLAQTNNNTIPGKVSYISSQNIYIKFGTTKNITAGDTLYILKDNKLVPALVVNNLSSTSCVCTLISKINFTVSMPIYAKSNTGKLNDEKKIKEIVPAGNKTMIDTGGSSGQIKIAQPKFKQKISGSISASSYSNFSNVNSTNSTRFRYQLAFNAMNMGNSKFSFESNVSFQHEKDKWNHVRENIYHALKVYNLSFKYDNNKNTQFVLGRKMNSKIPGMGAIDGLQYEGKLKNFFIGIVAGSRPKYTDYSFDFSLPQLGAYIGHSYSNSNGEIQNSLAVVEQTNNMKTDRRFAYFQHSNSLIKNFYLYGSAEVELFKNMNDKPENTFNLSNTYLLLSYKLFKRLSLSASYDNRKNIIYYETYKSFIDQIVNTEARQNMTFQINYYTLKNISFGIRTGYSFPNTNSKESRNLYGYISYYNIPGIQLSVTAAANYLETTYVNGKILNLNLSRNFFNGKLYTDCGYQMVDYSYLGTETTTKQNIFSINMTWQLFKNFSLSGNYEKTLDKQDHYDRLSFQIRKRF